MKTRQPQHQHTKRATFTSMINNHWHWLIDVKLYQQCMVDQLWGDSAEQCKFTSAMQGGEKLLTMKKKIYDTMLFIMAMKK